MKKDTKDDRRIVTFLSEHLRFERLPKDSADAAIQTWWKSFSTPACISGWLDKQMYWHCLSFGYKPSLTFEAAVREYNAIVEKEVRLLAVSWPASVVVDVHKRDVSADLLKELRDVHLLDLYVFDKPATWTFVRTHEEEMRCGPYFSRHSWHIRPPGGRKRHA